MPNRFVLSVVVLSVLSLAACGADGIGPPRQTPPTTESPDARFVIDPVPYWWLIGNALTPGQDTIPFAVTAPPETEVVDVWVGRGAGQRLAFDAATGKFIGDLDISGLAPGQQDILVGADGRHTVVTAVLFSRTHPLYFVLSTDWDFAGSPPRLVGDEIARNAA